MVFIIVITNIPSAHQDISIAADPSILLGLKQAHDSLSPGVPDESVGSPQIVHLFAIQGDPEVDVIIVIGETGIRIPLTESQLNCKLLEGNKGIFTTVRP